MPSSAAFVTIRMISDSGMSEEERSSLSQPFHGRGPGIDHRLFADMRLPSLQNALHALIEGVKDVAIAQAVFSIRCLGKTQKERSVQRARSAANSADEVIETSFIKAEMVWGFCFCTSSVTAANPLTMFTPYLIADG